MPSEARWRGRRDQRLAVVLGCLAVLAMPSVGWAWEPMRSQDGATVLAWPADTERFATCGGGRGDPERQIALWDAMASWWREGGVSHGLELAAGPCVIDAMDATIAVVRVDDPDAWDPTWGGAEQVIGFTIHTWQADGRLTDADLAFNDAHFALDASPAPGNGAVDLRWLAAHELGHALGLGHPCGDPGGSVPSCFDLPPDQADALTGALMFPSVAAGPRVPALAADDRIGIAAVLDTSSPSAGAPVCREGDHLALDVAEPVTSWATIDATGARTAGPLPVPARTEVPDTPFLVEVLFDSGARWIGRVAPCPIVAPDTDDEGASDTVETADTSVDADTDATVPLDAGDGAGTDDCACRSTRSGGGVTFRGPGLLALLLLLLLTAIRRVCSPRRRTAHVATSRD